MKHPLIFSLAVAFVVNAAVLSYAAPPRGLMQRAYYGGHGDCGCEAHGPIFHEPTCGCGEPTCCDPCCLGRALRVIPNTVRRVGCVLDKLFTCHRCYDPCCDMGCEVGCDAGCSDCWSGEATYPDGVPVPEAEGVPMSRTTRAYQNWNMNRRSVTVAPRAARPMIVHREVSQPRQSSVVKSKPAAKKPAKLPTRTASSARPLNSNEESADETQEDSVVRRTSYNEPVKTNSRVPHNPLRD